MTDYYPSEEGYIDDGQIVGFCKAGGSITLHGAVTMGNTSVSGYLSVVAAGVATGIGIALKAADTNDYIPVAFQGIVKQTTGTATFSVMDPVHSSGTTAGVVELIVATSGSEYDNMAYTDATTTGFLRLGYALQAGTTAADEVLIMLSGLA
jgi:hypothetical protein